eukprot:CAMPEP_0172158584 /NCGR_PEP_ID=MMETSP1050-20130122/4457_1 /TAXON_ID=233186 /ORGANISM="Cryptomonas curvata, Strain CCAP979/52" /LENGTH=314 /DNA_ID=CAMNT_0012827999 /DNA_START=282 /DNA_END=1222 /DNA_ORIENTATION=-
MDSSPSSESDSFGSFDRPRIDDDVEDGNPCVLQNSASIRVLDLRNFGEKKSDLSTKWQFSAPSTSSTPTHEEVQSKPRGHDHVHDHSCVFVNGCAQEAEPCAECASGNQCPGLKLQALLGGATSPHRVFGASERPAPLVPDSPASGPSLFSHRWTPSPAAIRFGAVAQSDLRCHASTAASLPSSEKRRRGPHAHAHAHAHRTHIWRSLSRRLLFHATQPPAEPAHAPRLSDAAPAARPPPPPPPITPWQLRRHRCAEDCWLAAHGAVYDVTLLLRRHPGGDRALLRRAGGDCSEDHDFHSAAGRLMWARYRIGS